VSFYYLRPDFLSEDEREGLLLVVAFELLLFELRLLLTLELLLFELRLLLLVTLELLLFEL
jgi:hypothetical protein